MKTELLDPATIRAISKDERFVPGELYPAESSGHKFKIGDELTLTGLVDFPEYNGQKVAIKAFRKDGDHGKAYYIDGEVNAMLNWVYEYRLA